ncbi:acetyl-CoA carboxylase biotin carboxyl carrier protein subunit [bacterium]|nr:acetyl-CoA carboxylase biotin carboxyl carrier protein subunit [bacterium]
MPGTLIGYLVKEGDDVVEGQPVVVLEAMKMENQLQAPKGGKVAELGPKPGSAVKRGQRLLVIE